MEWHRPYGGACGQQVTRTGGGYWRCPICNVVLTPREAGLMLSAVITFRNISLQEPDLEKLLCSEDIVAALKEGKS